MSALGRPNVVSPANNDDQSVMAASWPLPSGSSKRAVRMPVIAFRPWMRIRDPMVCPIARMPRPCVAVRSAGATSMDGETVISLAAGISYLHLKSAFAEPTPRKTK